jgi:hypothetical protein
MFASKWSRCFDFFRSGNGMGRRQFRVLICRANRWIELNSMFLTQLTAARFTGA